MRVIKAENLAFCIIIHQYTLAQKCAYDRLVSRPFVSLTALKGEDTMSSKALTVRGRVRELGYRQTTACTAAAA